MSLDQTQFLNVIDRDEAERRFRDALQPSPLPVEIVPLEDALGRVLAADVASPVDVPSFDRSNFDGFAIRAADTQSAHEEAPVQLTTAGPAIPTGELPTSDVANGEAIPIATGGMLPRGADAIAMIEHCDVCGDIVWISKSVAPGFGVSFAGTDIARGETVLYAGTPLTSRETGVLAAMGIAEAPVHRRPIVAILSTGDEIIAPGEPMRPPLIFDSNSRVLADAVRELGGEPLMLGIVPDNADQLRQKLTDALSRADAVLLSGGTSKGAGDISYRVVGELNNPGVVAHGVALKPGKPICLAVSGNKPVVILPGFPTSAIFTFHEFVAPVLRRLAGRQARESSHRQAKLATKINSAVGRTEYMLVNLVEQPDGREFVAFPIGKGSGSVTTFSHADGFITIGRHEEFVDSQTTVDVQLLASDLTPADLVVIGSHCLGLDFLLSQLNQRGVRPKFIAVGSTAGLHAATQGHCDIAGIHLLDKATGQYNRPFVGEGVELAAGYRRRQGFLCRRDDQRFAGKSAAEAIAVAAADAACQMVNRNQGSGTRILIDGQLGDARPPGYTIAAKSHTAVAAAIAQGRADWGVAIEHAARQNDLAFLPLADECFDFVVPKSRLARPAVRQFIEMLTDETTRTRLAGLGLVATEE